MTDGYTMHTPTIETVPPDHRWDNVQVLCKLYTGKELSRMCMVRGLRGTGPSKRVLAQRIVGAPLWTDELLAERRDAGLPLM